MCARTRDGERITALFQDEFYMDCEAVQRAVEARGMFNIVHMANVVKVDLLVRKDTEYWRTEFAGKRRVLVEGQELFIVAPEDLILSKLERATDSRSEVQLGDVRNLLMSVPDLDKDSLTRWAEWLSVGSLYREVCA